MTALALKEMSSPALAPSDDVIDLVHLSRMTLGERSLEREVLAAVRPPVRHPAAAHAPRRARRSPPPPPTR